MRKMLNTLFFVGVVIFLSACSNKNEFKPAEYVSTTGSAQPGKETRIELEDGAAIVIPSNSIDAEVSIIVERNPEKAKTLPSLGEGVIQLGDFYNFEVTDGEILGPVDLVLSFDESMIPEEQGVLVFGYPTKDGWEYIPVESNGNSVTVYTANLGDPLIAWSFLSVDSAICDPKIPLKITQNGDSFLLEGQLVSQHTQNPEANIPVYIRINHREVTDRGQYITETDENGAFSFEVSNREGLKPDWNWVFVYADCDEAITLEDNYGNFHSEGYAEFKYEPEEETEAETASEEVVEEEIPESAVLLPDFIGQDIDNAIKWLEENGFGYTWVDGNSSYDLGLVFDQAPLGGTYKVPHRTVVILYRTIEQIEPTPTAFPTPSDPNGCDNPELTPEERVNCGTHTYSLQKKAVSGGCYFVDKSDYQNEGLVSVEVIVSTTFTFSPEHVESTFDGASYWCSFAQQSPNNYLITHGPSGSLEFASDGFHMEEWTNCFNTEGYGTPPGDDWDCLWETDGTLIE